MNLDEILKLNNIDEIFSEAEKQGIDKNLLMKSEDFKEIIYQKFKNEGISYSTMRNIISNVGEKSCLENLDIDRVMESEISNEVFFTTLLENGDSTLLDKVINDEKYMDYFFKNLNKNYSAMSFCDSKKVMELVDKVNTLDKNIPNIENLSIGLSDEEKRKVLQGDYKREIVLSTIDKSSDEIVQDYIDNNPKALYMYKDIGVMKLANRGISFPSDIIKQKEFFEQIKDTDIVNFRRNINIVNRNSYHPVLSNKIKKYEENILKDFNPESELFNCYDLSNTEKLDKCLYEKDTYLMDYKAKSEINAYLRAKRNFDEKRDYYNNGIKQKLNLNIDIDELNDIDIDSITDDERIIDVLNKIKDTMNSERELFNNTKNDVTSNLKDISSQKFGDMFIDFKFEDTKKNVKVNSKEMLRYNSSLDENEKILNEDKQELYNTICNIDKLNGKQKYEIYESLNNRNMVAELYNDFSTLKKKSYEEINKALYKTETGVENLSIEDSNLNDTEIHRLKGNPFYMLVRVLNNPIHEDTMNAQSCYSLISGNNTTIFHEDYAEYIYGYDNIEIDSIENVFESDSYTFASDKNITTRPNRIMTKEEITESSESYSEINIKNKENGKKQGRKYKERMPSYVVSMDNPTKEQIEESKRLGIPLVVVERERYKNKKIDDIEYEEYDHDIN